MDQPRRAGADGISIFDAVDKQLGLKLEAQKLAVPVIVVDGVNETPTPNPPGVTTSLPPPAEFEVPSKPGTETDIEDLRLMLRVLLADRFELKTHMETRLVDGYVLSAVKPKMQKADPSNRTGCKEGPGPDGKDPRTRQSDPLPTPHLPEHDHGAVRQSIRRKNCDHLR